MKSSTAVSYFRVFELFYVLILKNSYNIHMKNYLLIKYFVENVEAFQTLIRHSWKSL